MSEEKEMTQEEVIKEISVEGQEEPKEEYRLYPKKRCKCCWGKGFARFFNNVNPRKNDKAQFEPEVRPCGCIIEKAQLHFYRTNEKLFPVQDEEGNMCLSNIKSEIEEPETFEPINTTEDVEK